MRLAVMAADTTFIADDRAAAAAMLAPEVLLNSPMNRVAGRDLLILALQHNMISYVRYERHVEGVAELPGGAVAIAGAEKVWPKSSNAHYKHEWVSRRFTDVWREEAGVWLLSVRHANDIATG
jgi:hypothetical protein